MIIFDYWKEIMIGTLYVVFILIPVISMIAFIIPYAITNGIETAQLKHMHQRNGAILAFGKMLADQKKEEQRNGKS